MSEGPCQSIILANLRGSVAQAGAAVRGGAI